jgi:hypothetical protein
MSKLINKTTPKQFFVGDRAMLRDKRLSADAKNIYIVLRSLGESCDNVCPTYPWIANEIGYETEGKSNQSISRFILAKMEELEKLEMILRVRKDRGYDYEIYDYSPESHSTKVMSDTQQKGRLTLNKSDECYKEKKDIRKEDYNTLSSEAQILDEKEQNKIKFQNEIDAYKKLIKNTPTYDWSVDRITKNLTIPKDIENIEELALTECASWMVKNNKSPSVFESYLEIGFNKVLSNYRTNTQTEITMQKKDYYGNKAKPQETKSPYSQPPSYEPHPQIVEPQIEVVLSDEEVEAREQKKQEQSFKLQQMKRQMLANRSLKYTT